MKKSLILAFAVLVLNGCAESTSDPEPVCGNGNLELGEACDLSVPSSTTCSQFDATKTWQPSGRPGCSNTCTLTQGTCKEIVPQPGGVCGDGILNTGEVCDREIGTTCDKFDATKTWEDGGKAQCASDCKSLSQGTCKEKEAEPEPPAVDPLPENDCTQDASICTETTPVCDPTTKSCVGCLNDTDCEDSMVCSADKVCVAEAVSNACGDGKISADEKCDTALAVSCSDFDQTKTWEDGGKAQCASDCQRIEQGTCVEAVEPEKDCTQDEKLCSGKTPICHAATKSCVECETDSDCNGENMMCDTSYRCSEVLEGGVCEKNDPGDIYWCQTVKPVEIVFSNDKTSAEIIGYYRLGTGAGSNVEAQLAYGQETGSSFKGQDKWKTLNATLDNSGDIPTMRAMLTKTQVEALGGKDVYYVFRMRTDSNDAWNYCKTSQESNVPAETVDCSLKPYQVTESSRGNSHQSGSASVDTTPVSNVIAQFTMDKKTNPKTDEYKADKGSAVLTTTADCVSGCFSNGSDAALNLQGWSTERASAIEKGKSITLSNLNLTGATGIALSMDVWRNNKSGSPTKIAVLYKIGTNDEVEVGNSSFDIELDAKKEKVFENHSIELPKLSNQADVSIRLVPYGGNGATRFDNIIVTKNNF